LISVAIGTRADSLLRPCWEPGDDPAEGGSKNRILEGFLGTLEFRPGDVALGLALFDHAAGDRILGEQTDGALVLILGSSEGGLRRGNAAVEVSRIEPGDDLPGVDRLRFSRLDGLNDAANQEAELGSFAGIDDSGIAGIDSAARGLEFDDLDGPTGGLFHGWRRCLTAGGKDDEKTKNQPAKKPFPPVTGRLIEASKIELK